MKKVAIIKGIDSCNDYGYEEFIAQHLDGWHEIDDHDLIPLQEYCNRRSLKLVEVIDPLGMKFNEVLSIAVKEYREAEEKKKLRQIKKEKNKVKAEEKAKKQKEKEEKELFESLSKKYANNT